MCRFFILEISKKVFDLSTNVSFISVIVIVKATNGPRYVVGCRRQVDKSKLKPSTRVALDMTTLTIMRLDTKIPVTVKLVKRVLSFCYDLLIKQYLLSNF